MSDPVALNGHANVPVLVGACLCPGTPHEDGDYVYLRPKMDLRGGMRTQQVALECINNNLGNPAAKWSDVEISARLREIYILAGIVGWTLEDENGPIPMNDVTVRFHLLEDFSRSQDLGERADELYSGPVILPLVHRLSTLSPSTPTGESTSATPKPSPKRPKRSKRSSISTIPMDDTETTTPSLAGVSKS